MKTIDAVLDGAKARSEGTLHKEKICHVIQNTSQFCYLKVS